jgi:excisionase family DNA binding protein
MARLTVKEAATEARRHEKTIAEALRAGELHGTQRVKGGTWLIKADCLEAWMDHLPCEHKSNVTSINRRSA